MNVEISAVKGRTKNRQKWAQERYLKSAIIFWIFRSLLGRRKGQILFFSSAWGQPEFSRSGCPSTKRNNFWTVSSCTVSRGEIRVHISISNICDFQERSSNVWWPTQADTNLYSFEVEIKIFFTDMSLNHPQYVIWNGRPPTLSCRVNCLWVWRYLLWKGERKIFRNELRSAIWNRLSCFGFSGHFSVFTGKKSWR